MVFLGRRRTQLGSGDLRRFTAALDRLMQILDRVLAVVGERGEEWRRQVTDRRRFTAHDPVADALEQCADDLDQCLIDIQEHFEFLSVGDYAALHRVAAQTVRNWIHAGELEAYEDAKGYAIPRHAQRQRKA